MSTLEISLPLTVQPEENESGRGYCLRALSANGLDLRWLKRAIGVGPTAQISATHAQALAHIFGIDSDWWRHNLPEVLATRPASVRYAGQTFTALNHLRAQTPQVCPDCLRLGLHCQLIWDIALSTVCIAHHRYLEDECPRCNRQLRWERPAMDVCDCGAYLNAALVESCPRPTHQEVQFQELLEAKMFRHTAHEGCTPLGLPAAFAGLSIDGLIVVTLAFGVLPRALAVTPASARRRRLLSRESTQIIKRALRRLGGDSAAPQPLSALQEVVSEPFLKRLLSVYAHDNDRIAASSLLAEVFGCYIHGQMQGRYPELSQISLFE